MLIFFIFCISCFPKLSISFSNKKNLYDRVVFMAPKYDSYDKTIQLNNHQIDQVFFERFRKGWLIEANKKQTFNLYLILNDQTLSSISPSSDSKINQSIIASNIIRRKQRYRKHPTHLFYMYFTSNDKSCDDYLDYTHIPIYLDDLLMSNKKLKNNLHIIEIDISLKHEPMSPYYICLSNSNIQHPFPKFIHQGNQSSLIQIITYENKLPIWIKVCFYILLVCFNSIFNGLNLGLMALSVDELELLVKTSDSTKEKNYAKNILPLRRKRNYLLCSILLSVTLTSSVSTLILDDLVEGFYASIISTITLCLVGEILPQSICSKFALPIGSYTRNFTYMFIYLTTIISYPLSKIVDFLLGDEIPTKYSRDSIKEIIKKSKGLEEKQCQIINGVLDLKSKIVENRMIDLDNVYMLDENEKLTFEMIVQIYNKGYSRIPVYSNQRGLHVSDLTCRQNIVGWFHIKDLTLIDPNDEITVKQLLSLFKHHLAFCYTTDSLFDMLLEFRNGSTHMAFVLQTVQNTNKDPYEKCVGIITLHDVIEALLQYNVNNDQFKVDNIGASHSFQLQANIKSAFGVNYLKKLIENHQTKRIFSTCSNLNDSFSQFPTISEQLKLLLIQVLITIKPFKDQFIDKSIIEKMFNDESVDNCLIHKVLIPMHHNNNNINNPNNSLFRKKSKILLDQSSVIYLYKYREACDYFILLLEGSFVVEAGIEKTQFIAKQFDYFGVKALLGDCETVEQVLCNEPAYKSYVPEYSLKIDYNNQYDAYSSSNSNIKYSSLTYLKIERSIWINAVKSSELKRLNNIS